MAKIATIVGTRPQFIKTALLSVKLREEFKEILIHTGQHYDYEMSKIFFDEMNIPEPTYHLDVGSGWHGTQTALMMQKIEKVLYEENPQIVLVYGDTNSTLAGALVGAKMNIVVAHVEAGLRSFNKGMPEEVNRVLTDHVSTLSFCPTKMAVENLVVEGIVSGVHLVGDVMLDSIAHYGKVAMEHPSILFDLNLKPKEYCLATVHRAQNTDDPLNLLKIMDALNECPMPVVFPLHPRTKLAMSHIGVRNGSCKYIKPVSYLDMLVLEKNAKAIFTDSGGVQKEAYILKVPCITLREETEWLETVGSGWNTLVGVDKDRILSAFERVNGSRPAHKGHYGDGDAVGKIIGVIKNVVRLL